MNNLGNASNSGMWYLNNNSKIDIIGNRCHGLSLIGIDASDSEINILHNGYAGLYVQAVDFVFQKLYCKHTLQRRKTSQLFSRRCMVKQTYTFH